MMEKITHLGCRNLLGSLFLLTDNLSTIKIYLGLIVNLEI